MSEERSLLANGRSGEWYAEIDQGLDCKDAELLLDAPGQERIAVKLSDNPLKDVDHLLAILQEIKTEIEVGYPEQESTRRAVIECCYDDHTSYYSLDEEHVRKLLEVPHDDRNDIIVDNGKLTAITGDSEVDIAMVFDGGSHDATPCSHDEADLFGEIIRWLEDK